MTLLSLVTVALGPAVAVALFAELAIIRPLRRERDEAVAWNASLRQQNGEIGPTLVRRKARIEELEATLVTIATERDGWRATCVDQGRTIATLRTDLAAAIARAEAAEGKLRPFLRVQGADGKIKGKVA